MFNGKCPLIFLESGFIVDLSRWCRSNNMRPCCMLKCFHPSSLCCWSMQSVHPQKAGNRYSSEKDHSTLVAANLQLDSEFFRVFGCSSKCCPQDRQSSLAWAFCCSWQVNWVSIFPSCFWALCDCMLLLFRYWWTNNLDGAELDCVFFVV